MSEKYLIDGNDLLPPQEYEIKFEMLKEKVSTKNQQPYLMVVMTVRNDINENGQQKGKTIFDFMWHEYGTTRYKEAKIKALVNTQDIEELKEKFGKGFRLNVEQICTFLTGKNARIKVSIEPNKNGDGAHNKVERYMRSQYVVLEKPKVEEEPSLDDIDFNDLPF